jgi:hypothetical protein
MPGRAATGLGVFFVYRGKADRRVLRAVPEPALLGG